MSTFRTTSDSNPPKPRNPYPMNRRVREEIEAPIPDGPTEPISERRPIKRRNWGVFLATLVALFALNVAGVAIFVAWRASYLARATLQQQQQPAAPAAVPTGDGFDVSYAQEPLRVQVGCSAVLFLDLDEPRSNAAEKVSDLRYDSRCGDQPPSLTLGPGAAGGSQVKSNDTDAAGCAKAIRTSPIGPGAGIPVRKGTVLCILTAAAPARMTLVEITDVGKTGTAGMRATSWKVAG